MTWRQDQLQGCEHGFPTFFYDVLMSFVKFTARKALT